MVYCPPYLPHFTAKFRPLKAAAAQRAAANSARGEKRARVARG